MDFCKEILGDDTGPEFKRKLLNFVSYKKRCFNCGYFENKIDTESMLIICPVLRKPICYTCKSSEAFKLISATSAARKYKVDKKDIDMLTLPYIDAPNPYYTALKMKLYYEFMIVENLEKIKSWRDFKKDKQKGLLKEHFEARRQAKIDDKKSKTLFALEIEFRRKGDNISRDDIMNRFVNHPYMERFLAGKLQKNLAEMVKLIESGKADELEKECIKIEGKKAH